MKPYDEIRKLKLSQFKRMTGISMKNFEIVMQMVIDYLKDEKLSQPMRKRGIQSNMKVEDKILLTLFYLRHYPTFSTLGGVFNISESYAHKIYHRFSDILIKVLKLSNRKVLLDPELDVIIIDVTHHREADLQRSATARRADRLQTRRQ